MKTNKKNQNYSYLNTLHKPYNKLKQSTYTPGMRLATDNPIPQNQES